MSKQSAEEKSRETGETAASEAHGYLVRDESRGVLGAGKTNTGAMTVASQGCINRGAEPDNWIVEKVSMDAAAAALGFLMLGRYPKVLQRLAHARPTGDGKEVRHVFCIAGSWVTAGFTTDRRTLVGIAWPVERGSPQSVLPNCPDCKAQGSLTPAPDYTESGGAVRCSNCDSRFGSPAEGAKTDLTLMNEPSGPDQAWVLQHNRSPKGIGPTVDAAIADAEKRFGEGLFAARRENRTELLSVDRKSGQELEDAWNALENLVLSDAGASIAAHFDTRTPPVLIPIEIEDLEKLTRDIETMKGRQAGASRRSRSSTGPRRSSGPHKGGDVQQQADLQVHPAHSGMRRS